MTKGYKRYKWHLWLHLDTTPRKQNHGLFTVYISVTLNNWQRRPCGTVCLGVNVPFLIFLQVLPVRLHWCWTKACLARGTGHLNLHITLSYQYTIAKAIHVATHKFEVVDVWIDDLAEIIGVVVSLPSLNLPHSATHWHVRNHTTPPTPPHWKKKAFTKHLFVALWTESLQQWNSGHAHLPWISSDLQCSRQLLMIFSCLLHITWQYLSTSPYGTLQLRSIHVVQTMLWPSVDSPLVLVVLEGTSGVLHMLHAQRSSANFSHLIPFLIPFLLYGTVCWYKMYEYDSVRPKNEVAANPAEELLVDVTCPPENRRASLTVCRLPAYAHSRLLQEVQ